MDKEAPVMNQEYKLRWIYALRSGNYKQGFGALVEEQEGDSVGYCCLGVLNSLLPEVLQRKNPKSEGFLSSGAEKEVGVDEYVQSTLVGFNDSDRKSFAQIADWIEKNL